MAVSPINAASDVLDRADELLKLNVAATPIGAREDIRRLAWVMGVAAIDTYLHWAVHRVDLKKPIAKELRNTAVPLSDLIDLARSTVSARQLPKANKQTAAKACTANIRPMVRVRNALHSAILKQTFQGQNSVKKALDMLGVQDCWRAVGGITGETAGQITERLDSLTHRRNSIAHEGDIERQSRPRKIRRHTIDGTDVADMLQWVRAFVAAVDTLIP